MAFKDSFLYDKLKTFSDVGKAYKAGEITKDQGYAILEAEGFHKGDSTVEKLGKGLIGVVATVATAGLAAPLLGAGGAAAAAGLGSAAPLVKSVSKPDNVSLISSITKGISKVDAFAKTPLGGQLIGTLGKVVTNLATPEPGKPSTVPQQLALQAGNIPSFTQGTIGQNAVFDGTGVTVSLGKSNGSTWWEKNRSWALPVLLAVPGFFVFLFMLLGGRRR